jgi:hypothetical protein
MNDIAVQSFWYVDEYSQCISISHELPRRGELHTQGQDLEGEG